MPLCHFVYAKFVHLLVPNGSWLVTYQFATTCRSPAGVVASAAPLEMRAGEPGDVNHVRVVAISHALHVCCIRAVGESDGSRQGVDLLTGRQQTST
jgi:hypothetical protein